MDLRWLGTGIPRGQGSKCGIYITHNPQLVITMSPTKTPVLDLRRRTKRSVNKVGTKAFPNNSELIFVFFHMFNLFMSRVPCILINEKLKEINVLRTTLTEVSRTGIPRLYTVLVNSTP